MAFNDFMISETLDCLSWEEPVWCVLPSLAGF